MRFGHHVDVVGNVEKGLGKRKTGVVVDYSSSDMACVVAEIPAWVSNSVAVVEVAHLSSSSAAAAAAVEESPDVVAQIVVGCGGL